MSDTLDSLFTEGGAYAYGSRVDFLTDYAAQAQGLAARNYTSFNQGVGPTAFQSPHVRLRFFHPGHLPSNGTTLNLGLRYDYEQLPKPQIPNPGLPATSVFPKDRNNFGPRIGVAYDLSGRGSTVVRGGYGMFYGRIINSTISNAITNVGSPQGQLALTLQNTSAGAPLPQRARDRGRHAGAAGRRGLRRRLPEPARSRVRPDLRAAAWSQHDGSVSYVGSAGRHLPLFIDANLPAPSGTVTYLASGGGPFDGQAVTTPIFTGRGRPNFGRISRSPTAWTRSTTD